jgi:flagellar protein FlaI
MAIRQLPLSPRLDKHVKEHPYLLTYITEVAKDVGLPQLYETFELSYDMKKLKNVNLIYPVGEGIYIHIYTPPKGTATGYRRYVAIEPSKPIQTCLGLLSLSLLK